MRSVAQQEPARRRRRPPPLSPPRPPPPSATSASRCMAGMSTTHGCNKRHEYVTIEVKGARLRVKACGHSKRGGWLGLDGGKTYSNLGWTDADAASEHSCQRNRAGAWVVLTQEETTRVVGGDAQTLEAMRLYGAERASTSHLPALPFAPRPPPFPPPLPADDIGAPFSFATITEEVHLASKTEASRRKRREGGDPSSSGAKTWAGTWLVVVEPPKQGACSTLSFYCQNDGIRATKALVYDAYRRGKCNPSHSPPRLTRRGTPQPK